MGRIIGIDLGTTNSLVALTDPKDRQPVCLPDGDGRTLLPSVVSIVSAEDGGAVVTGWDAQSRLLTHPERTIYSVKRFMGRDGADVADVADEASHFPFHIDPKSESVVRIHAGDQVLTPPEVSAHILKALKERAEQHLGEGVTRAVITVPAHFNDAQRQATKDAGRIAGLEVDRLVNEPTAASLAYGLDKRQTARIAVYDFGGGTFDITILELDAGLFKVLSTNGDTHLGGDDLDQLMVEKISADIKEVTGADATGDPKLGQALRHAVIAAKHELSQSETAELIVSVPGKDDYKRIVTRTEFEEWIAPTVERTLGPCRQALKDAGLQPSDSDSNSTSNIDEVVLVGGSTRVPLVRRKVEELFGRAPHSDLNPDEVVALGAAVQASILEGGVKDLLLLDVAPLSLGIETMGGAVAKIILRNSTIPASATEMFTTYQDNQTGVDIHVVQGERELVSDCRSLAKFTLKVPPQPAGLPRIEVKFLIDANGILSVAARDVRTGHEHTVEVKPSYGLTDEQVESMILSSIEHAEEDFAASLLIGARNEAETVLGATVRALEGEQASGLITEEREALDSAVTQLREAMNGGDHKLIRKRLEELNEASHHLAELVMNTAVETALKGKKAGEVEV